MENFHFRLKFGEIEIEASGSENYVREIKAYSDDLIKEVSLKSKTIGAVPVISRSQPNESEKVYVAVSEKTVKEESIVEFLEQLPNKTHQDKILAFGYYLEKNRRLDSFGVKEINDCYEEVKEAKSNTAQYLALLVKSGLIMKAKNVGPGGSSQYTLTRKGESVIQTPPASAHK